jgi:putative transcriptional regulator
MAVKILLKQVRTSRKLSQNKLAQLVGMTLQNVQRIEYGDAKSIPLETLDKLCKALKCQPGDLLVWMPDDGEQDYGIKQDEILGLKQISKDSFESNPSSKTQNICSFITVIPALLESA